jgi:hypothetical protein
MHAWETDPAAFGPEDPDDDDDQGMEARAAWGSPRGMKARPTRT